MKRLPIGAGAGAQLFALSGLALAQPVLELLALHPAFLVAHRASAATIALVVAALLIAPPGILWVLERAVAWGNATAGEWLHRGFVGVGVAVIALPVLTRSGATPMTASAGALLAGTAALVAHARWAAVQRFLMVLAVAPLVFVVRFAAEPAIQKLLSGDSTSPLARAAAPGRPAPVVIVVFDELPLASLLDENEQIDPVRYPAFARLAASSTWLRNASTVHVDSVYAIPALLSGLRPEPGRLATASDHPRNLFALLDAHYRVHAIEPVTRMYEAAEPDRGPGAALAAIASDLVVIYLHFLLPEPWAVGLPPVTQSWRGFARTSTAPSAAGSDDAPATHHEGRVQRFHEFIDSLAPPREGEPPVLHFLHTLLPHPPWEFLPSGRAYFPPHTGVPGPRWGREEWWVDQGYQQHLLQLSYTDGLLGRLLDRMEDQGLFDAALVVVTSDHGAGFWPGESRRDPRQHPEGTLSIPLFIKAPGQRAPRTILRNVESVDVLPSIADLLELELPWPTDGCSAFDPDCPERAHKVIQYGPNRAVHRATLPVPSPSLERKLALFGSGSASGSALDGIYELGPRPDVVGRRIRWFERVPANGALARVMQGGFALTALHPARYANARITGLLARPKGEADPPLVAVAIDNVIRAVVPALPARRRAGAELLFSALIPEQFAPADADALRVFEVVDQAGDTALRPVRVQFEAFRP